MRIFKSAGFSLVIVAIESVLAAQAPRPVRTETGMVQGVRESGITVYKGIPFAAPPLGELRWRAPKPAAAWTGVRNADKFAAACIQVPIVNRGKTGDSNGKGLPQWPAFTNGNAQVMNLNDPPAAIPVPNADKLQVLDGYYAWRRSQAEGKH